LSEEGRVHEAARFRHASLRHCSAWPVAASAQQSAKPVIGFLNISSPGPHAPFVAAFNQGLREVGLIEGQNLAIEYRWAEGQFVDCPHWRPTSPAAKSM